MKIICDKNELSNACQIVRRFTDDKHTTPTLGGILMTAKDGVLTLTGYNLEMGITTTVTAMVQEEGEIVINASMLSETVRRLPEKNVTIESDKTYIADISSGNFKSQLMSLTPSDYPSLPKVDETSAVTVQQGILKDMIKRTIYSAAIKDSKIVHTGIKFEIEENHIRLIAVDGVRFALRNENINYKGDNMSFVVPAKTLSEVVKLMKDDEQDITLNVAKRHIIFEVDGYSIISRLLDGEFLNYKAAIPKASKTTVKCDTREFAECVDRVSSVITEALKSPLKLVSDGDGIKVTSNSSIGSSSDRINADINGDEFVIGLNNKYILDALKFSETDEIKIAFSGATAPVIIKPTDGDSFVFLVLPVRLKQG